MVSGFVRDGARGSRDTITTASNAKRAARDREGQLPPPPIVPTLGGQSSTSPREDRDGRRGGMELEPWRLEAHGLLASRPARRRVSMCPTHSESYVRRTRGCFSAWTFLTAFREERRRSACDQRNRSCRRDEASSDQQGTYRTVHIRQDAPRPAPSQLGITLRASCPRAARAGEVPSPSRRALQAHAKPDVRRKDGQARKPGRWLARASSEFALAAPGWSARWECSAIGR